MVSRSLDLGCGAAPKNFFNASEVFGIDIREGLQKNIIKADLATEPIPFANSYFDYVTAHDVIEHIPRVIYTPNKRNSFVELMSEIWRVLKVGGKFLSVTPAYPHQAAFTDPTHVNIITDQTFPLYFDDANCWARGYGFKGCFKVEFQEWKGVHLVTQLSKVEQVVST
jgi:SAM-dependent methyltransferase